MRLVAQCKVNDRDKEGRHVIRYAFDPERQRTGSCQLSEEAQGSQRHQILNIYFTMGRYDGVIIFEAADAKTAIRFAADVGFTTDYSVETLTAIPAKDM